MTVPLLKAPVKSVDNSSKLTTVDKYSRGGISCTAHPSQRSAVKSETSVERGSLPGLATARGTTGRLTQTWRAFSEQGSHAEHLVTHPLGLVSPGIALRIACYNSSWALPLNHIGFVFSLGFIVVVAFIDFPTSLFVIILTIVKALFKKKILEINGNITHPN